MTLMVLGAGALLLVRGVIPMVLMAVMAVGLMIAGVAISQTILLRIRARVRSLGGQVCPVCLYDLSASPHQGTCPECGTPYIKTEVIRQWRNADQSYQAKKLYKLDE